MTNAAKNEDVAVNIRQKILEKHIDEIGQEFADLGYTPTRVALIVMTAEPDENGRDITSGFGLHEDGDSTKLVLDLIESTLEAIRATK